MSDSQMPIQADTQEDITVSIKAEQSVLGSMIINSDAVVEVSSILTQDDFKYDAHKAIYTAIVDLFKEKSAIDLVTLGEQLRKKINLDDIGGYTYISGLTSTVDYSKNATYYAKIVKEKSTLRQIIQASQNIISQASSGQDVSAVLEQAEKTIFDISQQKAKSTSVHHISKVLENVYNIIEENYQNKGALTGVDTGFMGLNHYTNGLQKTDLILIAARPAMGKTAFALNLAYNASKTGKKVMLFSLEMSKEQLVQRLLSAQSKVELTRIKSGKVENEQWDKVIDAIAYMQQRNIYIDDTAGINLLEIRSKCRKIKMQEGLDMVVIDYLQLMESETRTENRQQEISKISRGLKILAKELECPIIALSQLSRAPEVRTNHKPMLSDLRESGSIEQDADIVMFLYREDQYDQSTDKKNIAEIIIAKNRSGPTGSVELVWNGELQLFLNLESY